MNKKALRLLVAVCCLIILGLSLTACGGAAEEGAPAEEGAAPAEEGDAGEEEAAAPPEEGMEGPEFILIGSSAPLTGIFAGFGAGCTFGAQAAVDDINAQGGIYVEEYDRQIPVKLIVVDNESDPGKSGALAEDLILRDGVHMLYSVDSSPSIHIPIAEVAERHGIPHIVGGGPLEPWFGARSETESQWSYTWFPGFGIATPPPEGDPRHGLPGYTIRDSWFAVLDEFGDETNKVAGVFATDEPDGIGWYGLFPGLLEEWGATVIGVEDKLGFYPLGTTDFTAMCTEWKENDVEILWGNVPGPEFGTLWRQCTQLGFNPKIVMVGRAPLFYQDVNSWGGNLPQGVGTEIWWDPAYEGPGIGDTTPQSLADRWAEDTGEPLNRGIGHGYAPLQVLFDAVERAGSLDPVALNEAMAETELDTVNYLVKFDPDTHFSWIPLFVGQWQSTDEPWVWELEIAYSKHDYLDPTIDFIFPIPYE
jgi:ABC-type branched-subunit amino acid transport system substrate-binding protein